MQCWVFRMAQTKWKLSAGECAALFRKYDILGFIDECCGLLHLSSYACALDDIETMLHNQGLDIGMYAAQGCAAPDCSGR